MKRCDCHIHIISLRAEYPLASGRDYTPHEASVDEYRRIAKRLGLDRAVVIQPSIYGSDNACTREAILGSNAQWRGIAVVNADCNENEIRALHEAGFRGVRFNLLRAQQSNDLGRLESIGRLIAPFGWHIEFAIRPDHLCEIADRLTALPVHVAIDHMARLPPAVTSNSLTLKTTLKLLQSGKVWIKLSGVYIVSQAGRPYDDLSGLAKVLVDERSDRLVWGTNWPHPRRHLDETENVELLQVMERWGFDQSTRDAILVHNPARLYDF